MDKPTSSTADEAELSKLRKSYCSPQQVFTADSLASLDPFSQFSSWFDEARRCEAVREANAMCLSTATRDGRPSARFVLLKAFEPALGFVFFTGYASRKAVELEENPRAALTFYWEPLNRSVRIEGSVERTSAARSEQYFHSRPHDSQVGACLASQSTPIESRQCLEREAERLRKQYPAPTPVPLPNWGGYVVKPDLFEFWQGQSDRVHDRIRFRRAENVSPQEAFLHAAENGWVFDRLAP